MKISLVFVVAIYPSLNESPFNLLMVSISKTYNSEQLFIIFFSLRRLVMGYHEPTLLESLTVGEAKEQRSMWVSCLSIKENDLLGGV
jgi:hypothetical protein